MRFPQGGVRKDALFLIAIWLTNKNSDTTQIWFRLCHGLKLEYYWTLSKRFCFYSENLIGMPSYKICRFDGNDCIKDGWILYFRNHGTDGESQNWWKRLNLNVMIFVTCQWLISANSTNYRQHWDISQLSPGQAFSKVRHAWGGEGLGEWVGGGGQRVAVVRLQPLHRGHPGWEECREVSESQSVENKKTLGSWL